MPRKAREISENGIYYIYTRSLDSTVLCDSKEDAAKLVEIIKNTKAVLPFAMYAFSVTKCELHLLIKEFTPGGISQIMKKICFDFTKYRNSVSGSSGKLFKDRFKSEPTALDDNFLPLVKYIHQVPIKRGEVLNISAYPYCSYPYYFADGDEDFVDHSGILHYFAVDSKEALQKFKIYHAGFPADDMKPKERLVASRDEVAEMIKSIAKMEAVQIKTLEKPKRDALIKKIKKSTGLSIRQIAFATRLSRNTIAEVLKAKTLSF